MHSTTAENGKLYVTKDTLKCVKIPYCWPRGKGGLQSNMNKDTEAQNATDFS